MLVQLNTINNNYNKRIFPNFRGGEKVLQKTADVAGDTFVKSSGNIVNEAKNLIVKSAKDILNYLKINEDKIDNGKIFNIPVTAVGTTLLDELITIKKNNDELAYDELAYEALLYRMSGLSDIDYEQVDSMGISFPEKVLLTANKDLLKFIKDKKFKDSSWAMKAYNTTKDSEIEELLMPIKQQFDAEFHRLLKICNDRKNINNDVIKLLSRYIKEYKYGTEDFKEDPNQFLARFKPIAKDILIGKESDHVSGYCLNHRLKSSDIFKIYAISGFNKKLFSDLLHEALSSTHVDYKNGKDGAIKNMIIPTFLILKDNLVDFCNIYKGLRPYYSPVDSINTTLYSIYQELKASVPEENSNDFKVFAQTCFGVNLDEGIDPEVQRDYDAFMKEINQ